MPKHAGFTLVETIVVFALMGILISIAIPQLLLARPNLHLRSAVRELYSQMQAARMGAIKDNRDWAIVFDPARNQYLLCSHRGADSSWSQTADNTIVATLRLEEYGSGVRFGHGLATATVPGGAFPAGDISYNNKVVIFNSRGTATSGYVYLQNQGQEPIYAVGTLASGAIRIRNWSGSGWR